MTYCHLAHGASTHSPGGGDKHKDVPSEWGAIIAAASLRAVAQFGLDPCTRAQAAAHEAGHVVVAHALGNRVDGARLTTRTEFGKAIWVGITRNTHPRGSGSVTARENPALVFHCAVMNLAGFAGEMAAGLSHPTSSVDERTKARLMAEGVALALDVSAGKVLMQVAKHCSETLSRNRIAFDTIRAHLFRTRRLNRVEASRMLARVKVEPLL